MGEELIKNDSNNTSQPKRGDKIEIIVKAPGDTLRITTHGGASGHQNEVDTIRRNEN